MQIDIMPSLIRGPQPLRPRKIKKQIPLPKIIVRDPVTHVSWEQGKYTTFQICLRTDHPAFHLHVSTVRRRFSELLWLDNLLKSKNQGAALLPPPPPKRIFSDRFGSGFLKQRMKDMQKYLNKLLHFDQVLSDNAFHLFVQTDLSTSELTDYFNGKLSEKIIAEAWANMGHVHSNYLLSKAVPEEPQEIVMNEEDYNSFSDDSESATPSFLPIITSSSNTDNSSDTPQTDSASNSIGDEAMTNMGNLGLPARAEVEMGPALVVGEPAWQSESGTSGSSGAASDSP
ncbi:hypothetical protein RRG08_045783 [Elysia crispata]|uniref:PX domain-containing protein n=1 Tax=Elysia crispata TaxID=231223 RepID=A0AAE1B0N3_9GAST|nr:hypothetical protein RRG08_045783 [Elysia crispata]